MQKSAGMIKLNASLKQNLKELEDTTRMTGEISGLSTGYPDLDLTTFRNATWSCNSLFRPVAACNGKKLHWP